MYDLILFNNATKKAYLYSGLEDSGEKPYYRFEDFDIGDVPGGEYNYALIWNELTGVTYTFKNAILDTIVSYDGQEYQLRDLNPELGLLRYVTEETGEQPTYRDTEKEYYYRKK